MGSSGRHRRKHRCKHLPLGLAAGLAVVAGGTLLTTVLAAWASSPPARTGAATAPAAPAHVPRRAGRAGTRRPLATPVLHHRLRRRVLREPSRRAPADRILAAGTCEASFYTKGPTTADGGAYDPDLLTAAHRTLPMGSRVRVTNVRNDLSVIVRIDDRGPFVAGRCLDLSRAAMRAIGGTGAGVIPVRYEVLAR